MSTPNFFDKLRHNFSGSTSDWIYNIVAFSEFSEELFRSYDVVTICCCAKLHVRGYKFTMYRIMLVKKDSTPQLIEVCESELAAEKALENFKAAFPKQIRTGEFTVYIEK